MKIQLDLKHHCIETEIRRVYNQSVSAYFRQSEKTRILEVKISLLKQALETIDFGALRSKHPELAGHRPVAATLCTGRESEIVIWINARKVYP